MTGAWPSVTLGARMTTFAHPDAPSMMRNVFLIEEFAETRNWVRRVERLVPPQDVSTGALVGSVAMTAAITAARSGISYFARPCANGRMTPFPWPSPPQPTVTAVIPPYLLFPSPAKGRTLADVADRLEGAIARAEYRQPKYLGAGCNGFAIVLDLEHINEDGSRMRGALGFAPPSQEEEFSLAAYIKRLFYAPPGQYRQIVLLVSDQQMKNSTVGPTAAELRAITSDGLSALPGGFADVPYTSDHVVQALIYEFEKGPRDGDEATLIPPEGRLGATVHLQKAHLF
jgi:hypothetical protein